MSFSVKSFVPNWIRSEAHRRLGTLFTGRTPDPARIARMTATEPEVYVYCGHGGDMIDFTTFNIIHPPVGSIYVNYGSCGIANRLHYVHILDHLSNLADKILLDPVANKSTIEPWLTTRYVIPIKIHSHGEGGFVDNKFFPFNIFEESNSTFTINISGLVSRKRLLLSWQRDSKAWYLSKPMTSITLDDLAYTYFFASEYPTQGDILRYFEHHPRRQALVYSDLKEASQKFSISASALLHKFPGIHYNLLCRNDLSRLGSVNISAVTIARRVNSGQGTEASTLYLSYRDRPFVDMLEYVLVLEKTGRPLPSAIELQKILDSKLYSNSDTTSDDFHLKRALLQHMKTELPSRWRPTDEVLNKSRTQELRNKAYWYGLRNSWTLLSDIYHYNKFVMAPFHQFIELYNDNPFLDLLEHVLMLEKTGQSVPYGSEILQMLHLYRTSKDFYLKKDLLEHMMEERPSLWRPTDRVLNQSTKDELFLKAMPYSKSFLAEIGATGKVALPAGSTERYRRATRRRSYRATKFTRRSN